MHDGLASTSVESVARTTVYAAEAYEAGRTACDRWLGLPLCLRDGTTENRERCRIVWDAAVEWSVDADRWVRIFWDLVKEPMTGELSEEDTAVWTAFLAGWCREAEDQNVDPLLWGYYRMRGEWVR